MANTVTTNDLVNGSVTLEKLGSNVVDAINTKLPLGTIIMSTRLDTPFGFLPCDGGTYTSAQFPDFYDLLVGDDFGVKFKTVVLSAWDDEFRATGGYCGYYGIDTTNGIFKLPVFSDAFLRSGTASGMGRYGQDQIVNISGKFEAGELTEPAIAGINDPNRAPKTTGPFGSEQSSINAAANGAWSYGLALTFDASKQVKTGTQVQPRNISVRAFVQVYHSSENFSVEVKMNPDYTNATYTSVIGTSPSTATILNGVAGKRYTGADIVVESWYANDGSAWYRKYASGWLEQGGFSAPNMPTTTIINFPITFTNVNYSLLTGPGCSNVGGMHGKDYISSRTTNQFVYTTVSLAGSFRVNNFSWYASGY